ncbi:MAG: hypothetical protein KDA22_00370 [Phycisphaerales bacterium]|nr:hypothetical protein [Phycisphaerales bacterium]
MGASTSEPARPIRVACPLRFEQVRLQRVLPRGIAADCCGPGGAAAAAWVRQLPATTQKIALVGVAGGLADDCPPGHVCPIREVTSEDGRERLLSDAARQLPDGPASVRGASVERSATTPAAKRALRARTGAAVVDLESFAFAQAAVERGFSWLVVRIVSDGLNDTLPPDIDAWVAPDGRTRLRVVLAHILRHPNDLPRLRRLAAAANSRAYRAAAALVLAHAGHSIETAPDRGVRST